MSKPVTYKITPSDGLLPRYNIVLLVPRPDMNIEGHVFSQRPIEYGPVLCGVMLGWDRTGRKRAEAKGRREVERYLRKALTRSQMSRDNAISEHLTPTRKEPHSMTALKKINAYTFEVNMLVVVLAESAEVAQQALDQTGGLLTARETILRSTTPLTQPVATNFKGNLGVVPAPPKDDESGVAPEQP